MATLAPPKVERAPERPAARPSAPPPRRIGPEPQAADARRRRARLHLVTYTVGSALFWVLWAAISISADTWYWWALVPLAAWTIVLAVHIPHAYGGFDQD
jgi:hypothetical protein